MATDRVRSTTLLDEAGGLRVYMVGIKGTGMAALAELLSDRGVSVTGSDIAEKFYTDALLAQAGIAYHEGFDPAHITPDTDVLIYSPAYDPESHAELLRAREIDLPMLTYTQALGEISRRQPSVGISGVHGKTTTTALVSCMVQELELPGGVLAASALPDVGGRATLLQGETFFVAETCEYRRHFLDFAPTVIVVTSVEADHLDYFRDETDVANAFVEYARLLPPDGTLIFCADDRGASLVAKRVSHERPDVRLIPYGVTAEGSYRVTALSGGSGITRFRVGALELELHIPGRHNVLNAAAAIAVIHELIRRAPELGSADRDAGIARALSSFHGTRRRSEVIGEAQGILVLDDYGHHPTAIATTVRGLRDFYPGRRIVLSFMSHTYSRTLALLDELAEALTLADELILHDIYASAREANPGNVDGTVLADAVRRRGGSVRYVPEVLEAVEPALELLAAGDLFVTMGAGNNWRLGEAVLARLREGTQ